MNQKFGPVRRVEGILLKPFPLPDPRKLGTPVVTTVAIFWLKLFASGSREPFLRRAPSTHARLALQPHIMALSLAATLEAAKAKRKARSQEAVSQLTPEEKAQQQQQKAQQQRRELEKCETHRKPDQGQVREADVVERGKG